jgi:hypothetical protein
MFNNGTPDFVLLLPTNLTRQLKQVRGKSKGKSCFFWNLRQVFYQVALHRKRAQKPLFQKARQEILRGEVVRPAPPKLSNQGRIVLLKSTFPLGEKERRETRLIE